MIKGLFEIHVTIDHTTPTALHDLITFTLPRADLKRTCAVNPRGDWPNQYMVTKWSNGTEDVVKERAIALAAQMHEHGLFIKRVKVESMASNDGVREVCATRGPATYFEFHAKMALLGHTYAQLGEDILAVGKTLDPGRTAYGVSFNITGKTGAPIVDLQVEADAGRDHAIAQKDVLVEGLKARGYDVIGTLQSEYVVFDTHKDLDAGWLERHGPRAEV